MGPSGAPGAEGPRGDRGDKGEKGDPGPLIVATSDGGFDLGPFLADVAQLKAEVAMLKSMDCPLGYSRVTSETTYVVCSKDLGSGMVDELVRVGDFWIDRYELSSCGGSLGPESGYDVANPTGTDKTTTAVACSRRSVAPLANISWFQAVALCTNAGKHLCSNQEWQAAVQGTVDPGSNNGSSGACNTATFGATRFTGNAPNCRSRFGAEDMIGNLYEWVGDWQGAKGDNVVVSNSATFYGQDESVGVLAAPTQGNGVGFPAAAFRGGAAGSGTGAGAFALHLDFAPSIVFLAGGARCCVRRR